MDGLVQMRIGRRGRRTRSKLPQFNFVNHRGLTSWPAVPLLMVKGCKWSMIRISAFCVFFIQPTFSRVMTTRWIETTPVVEWVTATFTAVGRLASWHLSQLSFSLQRNQSCNTKGKLLLYSVQNIFDVRHRHHRLYLQTKIYYWFRGFRYWVVQHAKTIPRSAIPGTTLNTQPFSSVWRAFKDDLDRV
jgi:hypothetical protein